MLQATFEQLAMKSINGCQIKIKAQKMLFPAKSQLTRQNRQPLLSIDLIFYFKLCSVLCIVYICKLILQKKNTEKASWEENFLLAAAVNFFEGIEIPI